MKELNYTGVDEAIATEDFLEDLRSKNGKTTPPPIIWSAPRGAGVQRFYEPFCHISKNVFAFNVLAMKHIGEAFENKKLAFDAGYLTADQCIFFKHNELGAPLISYGDSFTSGHISNARFIKALQQINKDFMIGARFFVSIAEVKPHGKGILVHITKRVDK